MEKETQKGIAAQLAASGPSLLSASRPVCIVRGGTRRNLQRPHAAARHVAPAYDRLAHANVQVGRCTLRHSPAATKMGRNRSSATYNDPTLSELEMFNASDSAR